MVATAALADQVRSTERAVEEFLRVAKSDPELSEQVRRVSAELSALRSAISRWIKAVGGGA
jgi:hypothetical protein